MLLCIYTYREREIERERCIYIYIYIYMPYHASMRRVCIARKNIKDKNKKDTKIKINYCLNMASKNARVLCGA